MHAIILAALTVIPVYTNHNRVAGNVATMTNIQAWAQAVETAIGQGGVDTNAVKDLIAPATNATMAATAAMTNRIDSLKRDKADMNVYRCDWDMSAFEKIRPSLYMEYYYTDLSTVYLHQPNPNEDIPVARFLTVSTGGIVIFESLDPTFESLVGLFINIKTPIMHPLSKTKPWVTGTLATVENVSNATNALGGVIAAKADATAVYTKSQSDAAFATKATETTVGQWENYWRGDRVRLSVTNYYGNTSGEVPRLRIEEFDHSVTTVVSGVEYVTNVYRVVWDEVTRQTNYMERTDAKVDAISNSVVTAAWMQTNNQLGNKAPRAWQTVTSAGEAAPPDTVWHTAPTTVFAGGTEYYHVAVGDGSICVLVDKGAPVYTEGAEGQFRFRDESGENYFGFDVRQAYTLGCRTDGIQVNESLHMVSLTYDLTSEVNPTILHCTNLTEGVWSEKAVTWEQTPPVGTKVCYIDVTGQPQGYYKAQLSYSGGAKFVTNMMADLSEGIAATNESGVSTATQLPVYPVITSTGVVWRVKWGANQ